MPLSPLHYSNCHLTSWHREWYNSRPVFSSIYSKHLRQTGQEYGTFCSLSKLLFSTLEELVKHPISSFKCIRKFKTTLILVGCPGIVQCYFQPHTVWFKKKQHCSYRSPWLIQHPPQLLEALLKMCKLLYKAYFFHVSRYISQYNM